LVVFNIIAPDMRIAKAMGLGHKLNLGSTIFDFRIEIPFGLFRLTLAHTEVNAPALRRKLCPN